MTIQEQMQANLQALGLPYKQIDVYGGQIVITAHSQKSAEKWASVVSRFAKVKCVVKTMDYAKKNTQSSMNPSRVIVWRVFASIR